MKLSNKDLHYALWCAEKHTGNSLYAEAMADLEEAILEIEGYERALGTIGITAEQEVQNEA